MGIDETAKEIVEMAEFAKTDDDPYFSCPLVDLEAMARLWLMRMEITTELIKLPQADELRRKIYKLDNTVNDSDETETPQG